MQLTKKNAYTITLALQKQRLFKSTTLNKINQQKIHLLYIKKILPNFQ